MQKLNSLVSIVLCCTLCCLLSHCASYDYAKRKVQQGNLLPERKMKALYVGMPKREAAAIMGTSLMSPMFNNNRWDYAYTFRQGSTNDKIKTVSLYFKDDHLVKVIRKP